MKKKILAQLFEINDILKKIYILTLKGSKLNWIKSMDLIFPKALSIICTMANLVFIAKTGKKL